MAQLFTEDLLDQAAAALAGHRVRRGVCRCGAKVQDFQHHMAEVMAEAVSPALVAEMMDLLTAVARQALRETRVAS